MTIDTASYQDIYDDFQSALDWMRSLGAKIDQGRTTKYDRVMGYWKDAYRNASDEKAKEIFTDFVSAAQEIYDFVLIYKAFKDEDIEDLTEIARKLKEAIHGPFHMADESGNKSAARNKLFEVLTAAIVHRPAHGVNAMLGSESDTGVLIGKYKLWVECKRISSTERLYDNVRDASNQLEKLLIRKSGSGHRGIVALDISKTLHDGSKLLVANNDEELLEKVGHLMNEFIRRHRNEWEKVYKRRSRKIIGTMINFRTIGTSEERNLLVNISEWGLHAHLGVGRADNSLLLGLTEALKIE